MASEVEQALKMREIGRSRPEIWIPESLGFEPFSHQVAIAKSVLTSARTCVRSCSGIGKSRIAAAVILEFLYNFYPSTVLTTSSGFKQLENVLWREIDALYKGATVPLNGQLLATELNLAPNWFAIGISTDHIERFTGYHNKHVLVVGDEASGLDEAVYIAMENPMATGDTHMLLIGNPTRPTGGFRKAFDSEIFNKFHVSCFDTPNFIKFGITLKDIKENTWKEKIGDQPLPAPMLISPEYVYGRYLEWGEQSYHFQVFCMGNFPETGVNNLFKLSSLESAIGRETVKGVEDRVAALDVSRYGDDETIYGERIGDRVVRIETWSHQDTAFTAGRTLRFAKEFNPSKIVVDAVGVGGGVVDMLRSDRDALSSYVVAFNSGDKPKDKEMFGNRRAEVYWDLSKRFDDGNISLPKGTKTEKLKAQLCDIRYDYDKNGKLWIESKEEMRARGSKSPDAADMLMMLFSSSGFTAGRKTRFTSTFG